MSQHSAGDMKDDPEGGSMRLMTRSAPAPKEPHLETVRIITKDLIRDLRQVEAKGFYNVVTCSCPYLFGHRLKPSVR